MAKKKTPREKLHTGQAPELADMPANMQKRYGPGSLLIPTPLQVDTLIREIPKGEVRAAADLRDELGKREGAVTTCPLCFGIFWRISAEAAEQDRSEGVENVTPYWRVVKEGGKLNEKLPGGIDFHAQMLSDEGHRIEKGKLKAA